MNPRVLLGEAEVDGGGVGVWKTSLVSQFNTIFDVDEEELMDVVVCDGQGV